MQYVGALPVQKVSGAPDKPELAVGNTLGCFLDIRNVENGIVFPCDDQGRSFDAGQVDELGNIRGLLDEGAMLVETEQLFAAHVPELLNHLLLVRIGNVLAEVLDHQRCDLYSLVPVEQPLPGLDYRDERLARFRAETAEYHLVDQLGMTSGQGSRDDRAPGRSCEADGAIAIGLLDDAVQYIDLFIETHPRRP